jgi:uncharacterized protein (TIGR02444 family)
MSEAAQKTQPHGSPLWRFAVTLYREPGVADACLRLQDEAGADVNIVFFLLWNASQMRQYSAADVKATDGMVADWRATAVVPMRAIRRALKDAPVLPDNGVVEDYRTKVKGLELEAERLEHEALLDFFQESAPGTSVASPTDAARENLAAYESYLATSFPKDSVQTILAAFDAKHGRNAA